MDVALENYRKELRSRFGRVRLERPAPFDIAHRLAVRSGNIELLAPKNREALATPEHTQSLGSIFKAMGTSFPVLTK